MPRNPTGALLQQLWDEIESAIPDPPGYRDPLSSYNKGGRAMGRFVLELIDAAIQRVEAEQ